MQVVTRILICVALLLVGFALAFAIHAWQVSNSVFVMHAAKAAAAYPCIEERLLRPPAREYPAATFAKLYRFDQGTHHPDRRFSLQSRIAEVSAATAMDLLYSDAELNRMRASFRLGPFANFDNMARRLFDARYCGLSLKRRSLIARFERSTSSARFQKLLLEAGEKEALTKFNAMLQPHPTTLVDGLGGDS
jgi:hypothetical protein